MRQKKKKAAGTVKVQQDLPYTEGNRRRIGFFEGRPPTTACYWGKVEKIRSTSSEESKRVNEKKT